MPELSTRYEPGTIEDKWYKVWEKSGSFKPESSGKGPAYSIVIPPPNITGQLHVGHALNHTIQDVLIRHARKQGKRALWLPGTDHAGIATQAVVEKLLKEEGVSRFDLGREKFVKRIWQWKEKFGGIITRQMRTLGLSVDWSRERFTMDQGLSNAVRTAFTELYKKKLIYRDTRMIMWDPVTRTVLSDLEVDYDENHVGELYSFAYPLKSTRGEIVVATTRPETMLGDAAVAVHPDDPRYKDMIGKTVMHPFLEREVPIIADAILVDPAFGTGAVKVTPAHDVNDYETGKRHNLEFITIFDESGKINEFGGRFKGL
ncbi:MAG: class I tRNA ligase family protein, partial [Spirochaetia bacterium]|nr:class I tRNA ligase family protein [Spirochaetia bacterium]